MTFLEQCWTDRLAWFSLTPFHSSVCGFSYYWASYRDAANVPYQHGACIVNFLQEWGQMCKKLCVPGQVPWWPQSCIWEMMDGSHVLTRQESLQGPEPWPYRSSPRCPNPGAAQLWKQASLQLKLCSRNEENSVIFLRENLGWLWLSTLQEKQSPVLHPNNIKMRQLIPLRDSPTGSRHPQICLVPEESLSPLYRIWSFQSSVIRVTVEVL